MTNREIKRKVRWFRGEMKLLKTTYKELCAAAEKKGYTIISFNNLLNDDDVMELVSALDLADYVANSKGFTYADSSFRLIFIHEGLSEAEKKVVLSHELGHIVCQHFSAASVIGKDVQEEYEANEFAHYLLNPGLWIRTKLWGREHRLASFLTMVLLAVVLLGVGFQMFSVRGGHENGEYYVTSGGMKYHEKNCVFVKNKKNVRRIHETEIPEGDYKPCQVCLP